MEFPDNHILVSNAAAGFDNNFPSLQNQVL
jgi:hypothetical protein